ncbi:helix-turn-helix transcriptional regulator [Nocardia terpenica]|uniref:helix-turn-helix domain-containing protein n=1 Tax=Nocardia terpenica TaxID=455432 RepID=UPI001893D9F4|nr:helix-turn-helix transcriptional regulator [Nocardia terpenica]MBF6059410.1 helix-turn-helix transcriptional regulator [Nocardia terpenica]MBF6103051.1 helix-turn-helix transcriptional regulator [Nocardia terpenica]MBF6110760.1 helix-turn-helix transcriptional regulator [Nocardia terpenica]MBF6116891.1 helix-turn-helix transcriptional regulator [Nocardia terpenica]MBF6151271.1 helix-turn-helix transcriptional regulator [Nocardia terpenica]
MAEKRDNPQLRTERDHYMPVGAILQRYRKERSLTQDELAHQAGLSKSLITQIETGKRRAGKEVIAKIALVLDLSATTQRRLLGLIDPAVLRVKLDGISALEPTHRELSVVHSYPYPSCYYHPGTSRIIAANAALTHSFPGLRKGVSVVQWHLLSRWAKIVYANPVEWYRYSHGLVRDCRELLEGFVPDSQVKAFVEPLRQAREFDAMWNTPAPRLEEDDDDAAQVHLCDPSDGSIRIMYFRLSEDVYVRGSEGDGPWQHVTFSPAPVPRPPKRGPSSDETRP